MTQFTYNIKDIKTISTLDNQREFMAGERTFWLELGGGESSFNTEIFDAIVDPNVEKIIQKQ